MVLGSAVSAGVDPLVIQQQGTWASSKSMLNYVKKSKTKARQSAQKIDAEVTEEGSSLRF